MAVTAMSNEVWGALAFWGVLSILFGIAAVFWPGLTLVTLVYLFAGFILASGLVTFVLGLTNSYNEGGTLFGRILTVLLGVVEIGVGVYLLRHINVSFETFILLIGLALIVRGVIDFFGVFFEEGNAFVKTVLMVAGLVTVLAGIVVLLQPAAGGVAFAWILGLYALITGPLMIALATDMRKAL